MPTRDAVLLRLLGPLTLVVAGRPVHPGGPKQRALLAYLALHAGEPVRVTSLIEAVWGDDPPDGAIRSLRTYVSNLRRLLGEAADLRGAQGTYRLEPHGLDTDIYSFRGAVVAAFAAEDPAERSEALAAALGLWRGPFLADLDHSWVDGEAAILHAERSRALVGWAEATIAAGRPDEVIPTIERAVADAPLDERLGGLLMRALYRCGRHADALAVFRRIRDDLAREIGVEPGGELVSLRDQMLLHEASLGRAPANLMLPSSAAELIGRADELEDLLGRIEHVRLLTLTGPGGVGKTRLAIEVGHRVLDRGDMPVYFADLSSVVDEAGVDPLLASSAGVEPRPGYQPLASLVEYLAPRAALLIVDNCEHVASTAARSLAALVRSCPQLVLVATSRAPLHIDGELEWRTPSLLLPDDIDASIDEVRRSAAVQLLLQRAPSSFSLSEANRSDLVELCRSLDGLPLALELAASRLGSMTPAEILTSLGSPSHLASKAATEDARHATLDATISWSHELLDQAPRDLLDRLGVMSGRFLLDDVLAVCAPEWAPAHMVRNWMSSLVDQSLVVADTSGPRTRFGLLETIRRFALTRLGDGEAAARRRHARHFAALAEREAARLLTPEESDAVDELSAAHGNLRSAITWAMDTGDVGTASRIVASLPDWAYWRSRYELSMWARWVWEATTPDDPRWRAVCGSAARGAWLGGRFDEAIRYAEAATRSEGEVIAQSGHPDDVVADVALYRGGAHAALDHYSRVAAAARHRDDPIREVWADYYVAVINAVLRRPIEAAEAGARALAGARATGNPTALAFGLYACGLAAKHLATSGAQGMFENAIRMADSVDNDWFSGIARMELASAKAVHGNLHGSLRDFSGVIHHWHRVGDVTQLRLTWRYLVRVLADVGITDAAAVLTGALLTDTAESLSHPSAALQDELSARLGEARHTQLTVRGSIMTVPDLVVASLEAIDRALSVTGFPR